MAEAPGDFGLPPELPATREALLAAGLHGARREGVAADGRLLTAMGMGGRLAHDGAP